MDLGFVDAGDGEEGEEGLGSCRMPPVVVEGPAVACSLLVE